MTKPRDIPAVWKVETAAPGFTGPESDKVTFDLKATGGKLTGDCAERPTRQKPVALEGRVEGNTMRSRC
jgi:hypothetical protein